MNNREDQKHFNISYRTINALDILDIKIKKVCISAENKEVAINILRAEEISNGQKNIRIDRITTPDATFNSTPENKKTIGGWIALAILVVASTAKFLQTSM